MQSTASSRRIPRKPGWGRPTKDRSLSPCGEDTTVNDHAGQAALSECEVIEGVDERCVNEQLRIGRKTGRWTFENNCNTVVDVILGLCVNPPERGKTEMPAPPLTVQQHNNRIASDDEPVTSVRVEPVVRAPFAPLSVEGNRRRKAQMKEVQRLKDYAATKWEPAMLSPDEEDANVPDPPRVENR